MLHITNGDSAAGALKAADMNGRILPWRDVLHDGPVPGGLSLNELSEVRAEFIAAQGWEEFEAARESFRMRDSALEAASGFREVTLWFEPDLYDQLQLIQVLDWFAEHGVTCTKLTLVPLATYICESSREALNDAFSRRAEAGEDCLSAAAAAWSAFRLDEPSSLASLSGEKHASLPYLTTALRRLVEEYPCATTGLSRTERQILEAVRELGPEPARPGDTFKLSQAREEARFAGDAFVWTAMGRLSQQPAPLLATDDGSPLPKPSPGPDPFGARLTLTEAGAAVLGGKRNAVDCVGIDRWIGGVRLKAEDHWRREGDRLFPSEA